MEYVIAGLIAATVGLVIVMVGQLLPARAATIGRRLDELQVAGANPFGATQRRARLAKRERWEAVLRELGERTSRPKEADAHAMRARLTQAGYQSDNAPAVFMGVRIAFPLALLLTAVFLVPLAGPAGLLLTAIAAGFGWLAPSFYLDSRINRRKRELQKALPDALDLLVTTVEAGLGINQAIVRVAEEIRNISPAMAVELAMVNLEIRAGKPREEALRGLGERTGVDDLRSLAAMLIQTDRFGTSVVQALRVHADTMRIKRKQRAEEAAAKTTVKILFPLLLCVFPSLFVIIIGPAAINIYEVLLKNN
jgi:tight adherence protein C